MNKQYRIYWNYGKTELIEGKDFDDAFIKAGYNVHVRTLLEFYSEHSEILYVWDESKRLWIYNK